MSFFNLIRQNDVPGFVISSIYYNLFISKKSYVDKLNNKISKEMYERLLKKFRNEIEENGKMKDILSTTLNNLGVASSEYGVIKVYDVKIKFETKEGEF